MTSFENTMISLYGAQGERWLADLPSLIQELSMNWQLTDLKRVENLTYNYVLSGTQGSQAIILKLGMAAKELNREAAALNAFADFGAAKVIAHHDSALLLERIAPGHSLRTYCPAFEIEGIHIFCEVIKKLHQAPLPRAPLFPSTHDWLKTLDKEWDILPPYLEKARQLKKHLLATAPPSILLHGDLHHDNILRNSIGWTVIDPKGVTGDPLYDVAAFIRNPLPEILEAPDLHQIIAHRLEMIARLLGFQQKRLEEWCFVQAVLAWAWRLEDGLNPSPFVQLTEIFNEF